MYNKQPRYLSVLLYSTDQMTKVPNVHDEIIEAFISEMSNRFETSNNILYK